MAVEHRSSRADNATGGEGMRTRPITRIRMTTSGDSERLTRSWNIANADTQGPVDSWVITNETARAAGPAAGRGITGNNRATEPTSQ
jgi:hypothetical protein